MPTIYVLSKSMNNIRIFYLKICHFLVVEFSTYLNRRVFVMTTSANSIGSGETRSLA